MRARPSGTASPTSVSGGEGEGEGGGGGKRVYVFLVYLCVCVWVSGCRCVGAVPNKTLLPPPSLLQGTITMIYFAIFNIMELMFGAVFFREQLDPLTALVHHPVFTLIMLTGVTGNMFSVVIPLRDYVLVPLLGSGHAAVAVISNTVLPAGKVLPWNTVFVVLCLQELPTFLLGRCKCQYRCTCIYR